MLKRLAENFLIAANIFILFLIVFYTQLHIPAWLQVIGRMHPLLLHFPIVLLILALVLDLLMLRNEAMRTYASLINTLWLTGALTAAITAIMGLLLSKEEGYSGGALGWHKWSGLAIVWLASALYWYRYFRRGVIVTGGLVMAAGLAVAGHFGANLTHGNDFLLAPVTPQQKGLNVPIEKAVVFDHLVKPILEQKCNGCHNAAKAKGELRMETTEQLKKGGKSGALFVAGNPDASLMLERIHLPLEEKKHMPPKGKTQLDNQEIAILRYWIQHGADFKMKVASLPKADSLYRLAAQMLKPPPRENFTFAAAPEATISQLNNNYRVIYPLSRTSPALVANFYNKTQYSAKALEELLPLKKQLVELHLQKMPVKDEDLAIIKQFTNLRVLNLDYSAITGKTLGDLATLPHLHSLALSGTKITASHLQQLKNSKSLEEVFCWDTPLTQQDQQQLSLIKNIRFEKGFDPAKQSPIKLNPPIIENDQPVFLAKQTLVIRHPVKGTEIRYTLDGSDVDSLLSPVYKGPVEVDSALTVKARAYKSGWYGSDVTQSRFLKTTWKPDSAVLLKPGNEKYTGEGSKTLTDRQIGGFDFGSGKWLGFKFNDMELVLLFHEPVKVQTITLNTLRLTKSYIFPPARVEVWGGRDPAHLQLLKRVQPSMPGKDDPGAIQNIDCSFPERTVSCIKVVAVPLQKLPTWHEGKGQKAWVFVDEVLIN